MSMFSFVGAGLVWSRWLSWDICSSRAASISAFFPDACCWSQITTPSTITNAATNATTRACCFSHLTFMSYRERFCQFGAYREGKGLSLQHRVRWHVDHHAGFVIEIRRFAETLGEIVDQLNVALGVFRRMNSRAFDVKFANGSGSPGGRSAGTAGGFCVTLFSSGAGPTAAMRRGHTRCRATGSAFRLRGERDDPNIIGAKSLIEVLKQFRP